MARRKAKGKAVDLLFSVSALAERVRHAKEELHMLTCTDGIKAYCIESVHVQKSPSNDAIVKRLILIEEYESELSQSIEEWIRQQRRVDSLIAMIGDARQMQVLHMLYIEGADVKAIAKAMYYTPKTVYDLHNKGIAKLERILDDGETNEPQTA